MGGSLCSGLMFPNISFLTGDQIETQTQACIPVQQHWDNTCKGPCVGKIN